VPHAKLEVLAGAGHLPEVEKWRIVNDMVRDFLHSSTA
jgi:pimeloyl-ACP methyl ester carboxylesterase